MVYYFHASQCKSINSFHSQLRCVEISDKFRCVEKLSNLTGCQVFVTASSQFNFGNFMPISDLLCVAEFSRDFKTILQ